MSNITTPSSWVSEPSGRGTWSILSSCLLTITLCCWTSVCPNIPAQSDRYWCSLREKMHLACIGVLGPEFLLMLAMGQWSSARKSVKAFRRLNPGSRKCEWTMTHAFYADMGGFLLSGSGIELPFPIDATQLLFLIEQGYVQCPEISRNEIEDRNKSDAFSRCIAICQAIWLLLDCILRVAQGLSLTTLELTTVSFILVFFATSFCWYYKPQDITTVTTLTLTADINSIREKHCPPELEEWYTNPLDFLHPKFHICHILWRYYNQILLRIRCPIFSRPVTTRPYNRIPSDDFLHLDTLAEVIAPPIILIFGCLFMCAWRFHFPSSTEQLLWRIASTYTLGFTIIGGPYVQLCFKVILPRYIKHKRSLSDAEKLSPPQTRMQLQRLAAKIRNVHPSKDPRLDLPLLVLGPMSIICALYCLSRTYILVEDFVGLRDLPKSAFQTVEWSVYVPHW
ncbi:hypothetical protein BDW59DRAFT_149588 [Aspergillus cavernicola]|uniref:Uncharacterized protein n=1 Tax=Aspergillus cavernicola TaxID=176166 RepID=A0ABR4I382_9EURO